MRFLKKVPLSLGLALGVSILVGAASAALFLAAAAGAGGVALLPLSVLIAVVATTGFVLGDLRPYASALAAPASLGPEEGRRTAVWLARAPDRIALTALAGATVAVALALVLERAIGNGGSGLDVSFVGALLGGFIAAAMAQALATEIAAAVPVPASYGEESGLGLGIGDRILLVNGGTGVVVLAAFGLVVRADVVRHGELGPASILAGTGLIAVLIAAAWYSARALRSSMTALVRDVQSISAGDLTKNVTATGGGEIAQLAGALTKMSVSLKQILNNIKSVSSEVATASEDIAVSSSVMAAKIKDQADAVDSIASAVGSSARALVDIAERTDALGLAAEKSSSSIVEMMASIRSVAENAEELRRKGDDSAQAVERILASISDVSKGAETLFHLAERTAVAVREIDGGVQQIGRNLKDSRDLAQGVARDAREGGDAVRSLILAVEDIQSQVNDVAEVILTLDRKSWEITNILEVITDIADQTSLLALNAAIIAAQAGERGKGFAIIADEIKGLADRTGGATKEIGRVLREVKKQVATAGQGMGAATAKSAEGVRLSKSAGRALDEIIQSAASSNDRIGAIATAAEKAQAQSREIVSAVAGVTKVAAELRAAVAEQAKAGEAASEQTALTRSISVQVARAMDEQAQASRTIVEAVENSLSMVQGIGAATAGQKKESEAIERNVEQIRGNAQANTESVADLERVVQTLIQEAVVLRHEIDRFKTVAIAKRKSGFD